MKKVISCVLIVLCILTVFASCAKPEKKILGTWTGEENILGVVAKYSFTFNEDGTGSVTAALDVGAAMTYKIEGDQLSVTTSVLGISNTRTYTFVFEGDTLILNDGSKQITLTKEA
jgi:hypothetical protein